MADLELQSEAEKKAEEAQKYEAFAGLSLRHFRGQIAEALSHFGSFQLLEEYTKHDISHIDAMLGMYEWMIPADTKDRMTPADWLLLTLSTYLHDFGLLVTRDEFDARERTDKYVAFRSRIVDNDDPDMKDYRSQMQRLDADAAELFMYQEFVRYYHAERIRAWLRDLPDLTWGGDSRIVERLNALLNEVEETFREDVGLVCESHHSDDLGQVGKYRLSRPYGATPAEEANVQYAALLLRTSDLLHITRDRVPSMAALIINPRNPKSQLEWAKQEAVRRVRPKAVQAAPDGEGEPEQDTIEVHATFKDAEGYFGLTGYLAYAQKQLQQTHAWARENQATGQSEFRFPWRIIDSSDIEAKGFITKQFVFEIDQGKILDLLTGHTLYNDTGVVVRELVQNSLDAVRLQAYLKAKVGESYEPAIRVVWDSSEAVLSVTDNGIGMTQAIVERNFLRVGSSRYQEPEFQREYPDFASISRFGIGVLSTFMVADDVSVTTNSAHEQQARKLSLRDVHGQYLVRLFDKQDNEVPPAIREHGTSVSIKLRPSAELSEIESVLRHWIMIPGCDVTLTIDDQPPTKIGFDSTKEVLVASLTGANLVRSVDDKLKTPFGAPLEIRTATRDGLEISFAVAWNEWLQDWGYVQYDPSREDFAEGENFPFGVFIAGVRVTSQPPGFLFGGVAGVANATGINAPRTNVARSAIEKTDEYESMLEHIYSALAEHIDTEMHELQSTRASSLTRAVQEASYLAQDLTHYEAEAPTARNRVLRKIPSMVIEEDGERKAYSLDGLNDHPELATIESTSIESFERVLRSVRGATSPSLRNLIDVLGSDEKLPTAPLVCSMLRHGVLSGMFSSEWEVFRLISDQDGRTLTASWRRRDAEAPIWERPGRRTQLPAAMAGRMEREFQLGRTSTAIDRTFFAVREDKLDLAGLDDDTLLLCQGRLLVLPEHAMMSIEPTSEDVPLPVRLWCLSWLMGVISGNTRGSGSVHPNVLRSQQRSLQWVANVADNVRNSGVFEVLDEDSVREAIQRAQFAPLDVLRWDSRQAPE